MPSSHEEGYTRERHRGRLLEVQLEAAAGGRFEGLLGVVAEAVAPPQPATGRCKREGAHAHATHPWAKEGVAAVHAGWRGRGWQRRGCWRGGKQATCSVYVQAVCGLCAGRTHPGPTQGMAGRV